LRETYGGVVDHLEEMHLKKIVIPVPHDIKVLEKRKACRRSGLTREEFDKIVEHY